eukprot:2118624-Amphidinium_carterae.1
MGPCVRLRDLPAPDLIYVRFAPMLALHWVGGKTRIIFAPLWISPSAGVRHSSTTLSYCKVDVVHRIIWKSCVALWWVSRCASP